MNCLNIEYVLKTEIKSKNITLLKMTKCAKNAHWQQLGQIRSDVDYFFKFYEEAISYDRLGTLRMTDLRFPTGL